MNTQLFCRKSFASAALIAALCFIAPSVQAHTVHSRELDATVRTIQAETRTLVVVSAKTMSPLQFVWNKSTSFIEDDHVVDAAALREGLRVKIYYRSPFFGKPYLTKVIWNSSAR